MSKTYTAKTYREALKGTEGQRLAAEAWMVAELRRQADRPADFDLLAIINS